MFLFDWIVCLFRKLLELWNKLFSSFRKDKCESESPVAATYSNYVVPNKIIGGYFWAASTKVVKPFELNPAILTHVYYAFLELNQDGTLYLQSSKYDFLRELRRFKSRYNPNLKLLVSVVSKNESFSIVADEREKREIFVESVLGIIRKYEFDGLDLDWEFPQGYDKENFVTLLREFHTAFQPFGLLLTAAVRAIPIYDDSGYDVPEMVKYLDIINIMTYDYFGAWSDRTGFNAPLYAGSKDSAYEKKYLNVAASLKNWLDAGAPKEKICLGLAFYGRTFTLAKADEHDPGAVSLGSGKNPALTYYQIKTRCANWERVWDNKQKVPYKFNLDEWIGYDDEQSIHEKVKFALEQDVAGVFVWHLGGDDITGDASNNTKQYLLKQIYEQIIEGQQQSEEEISEQSEHASEESSDISLEHVNGRTPEEEQKEFQGSTSTAKAVDYDID